MGRSADILRTSLSKRQRLIRLVRLSGAQWDLLLRFIVRATAFPGAVLENMRHEVSSDLSVFRTVHF